MQKFNIFHKSEKFYWSTNKVVFGVIFLGLGIAFLNNEVLDIDSDLTNRIVGIMICCVIVAGLGLRLTGNELFEPIRGTLDGYLIFNDDNITAGKEIFELEQIKKIQISSDDYSGKLETGRDFGPILSNGTNNHLILFLEGKPNKKIDFELINSNDFQNLRITFIQYHLKGKMDFWELAHLLGEKSTEEIKMLTEEIQRCSTSANSSQAQ